MKRQSHADVAPSEKIEQDQDQDQDQDSGLQLLQKKAPVVLLCRETRFFYILEPLEPAIRVRI